MSAALAGNDDEEILAFKVCGRLEHLNCRSDVLGEIFELHLLGLITELVRGHS